MRIIFKSIGVLLLAAVVIAVATVLYWIGVALSYKHDAKRAVMYYLNDNYRGLEFKITNMHQGFFGGPFIDRAFTASVETEINAKKVNFHVSTDSQGKVRDYTDTLAKEKLRMDAEDDVRSEAKRLIPSLKGVYVEADYNAREGGSSPFTAYTRDMKWLSLRSISVSWTEESDLTKADFMHKSVQLGQQLAAKGFDYWTIGTSYAVNGTTKMSIDLRPSELDLPDDQLLEKVIIPTGQ